MIIPPRYKPIKAGGHGGMGATIECIDLQLNRKVVIKRAVNPAHIKRIVDEIVALQKAKSRHVVEIFDVIIDNTTGEIAIVEEHLAKDDLMSFHASGPTPQTLCEALYQIAVGLRDIHDCDIVHRDVKPNNMKYDQDDALKIFDFGLAKTTPLPASTVGFIGTPGFMAPELFEMPPKIDKAVDVYAFGATAFYLASGDIPPCGFKALKPPVALAPGQSINNFVPLKPTVAALVDQSLNLDPAARPTMVAIVDALKRELLFDRHRGLLANGKNSFVIDAGHKQASVKHGHDSIEIGYDGYDFVVTAISGTVEVNNRQAKKGQILAGSFVIALGAGSRRFVTFDVSHPEVLV